MAKGSDVLAMLIPTGGWVIIGNEFDSIIYDEGVTPVTKKAFEDGFAAYDAWKAEQEADKAAAKTALLNRLGITAEEAALLLGGN
jgi:hypothetical protein